MCLGPGDYSGMKGYRYCRTRNTVRLYQEPLAPSSAPNLASTRLHHLRRSRDFARPARIASVLRCNLLRPQKKRKKKNNNSNNKIVDRSSSGRFSHDLIPMVFGEKSADAKIAQCDFGDTIPRERASGLLVLILASLFPSSFPCYSRVITHADALRAYYAPCNASYTVYYHGTRCHFSRCAARARATASTGLSSHCVGNAVLSLSGL